MLLTISTSQQPVYDLGYLLHKHPDKFQTFELSFGEAYVFYPEVSESKMTVALMVDIDSIEFSNNRKFNWSGLSLGQYVNDRAFTCSSLLSVAISKVFGTAMAGNCKEKPDSVNSKKEFEVELSTVSYHGHEFLIDELFKPLGYSVEYTRLEYDKSFPQWGQSPFCHLKLKFNGTLQNLLRHLYILLPVLDNNKHYWVQEEEVHKLLSKGRGWLETHPQLALICNRYLKFQSHLIRKFWNELNEFSSKNVKPLKASNHSKVNKENLNSLRVQAITNVLRQFKCKRVIDIGCGDGKLIKSLLSIPFFTQIVGMDVSSVELGRAKKKINYSELPEIQLERVKFFQGSLLYKDTRLLGYDALCLIEVLEHIEPDRLKMVENRIFKEINSSLVIVTTPNKEFNVKYEMKQNEFRHQDHRFEWDRDTFFQWCKKLSHTYDYQVNVSGVGQCDSKLGSPTQMAVFVSKKGVHNE